MPDLLTLDIGTTSLKAAVFDGQGALRAMAAREYQPAKPRPDWLELDPEVYWEAACAAIGELRAAVPSKLDPAALGVTSQGETLVALDGAGVPLRPAIVWLDTRSGNEARALQSVFDPDTVYRRTGQQEMLPAWPATRMLWLREHEPDVFRRTAHYLLIGDYILFRLTGRLVSDRGLNPSTLYYDLVRGCWWDEMLDYLGVRRTQLPDLIGPAAVAGPLADDAASATGLPAGLPVVSAPIDQVCGAVGAGNVAPGCVTENTGAALALAAGVAQPVFDARRRVGLYVHGVPGMYMLLPWAPTAGMALRWFRDVFGGGAGYADLCREAGTLPPGAQGLLALPHFSGAGCPRVCAEARAVFWGVTLNHGRAHFTRALMESVAFMLRGNLEMLAELELNPTEVRSLGGAARDAGWLRIKADVCRRDLMTMECDDATSLGTALLAAVAVGVHADHVRARDAMVRERELVRHDPARSDAYDAIYRRYRKLEDLALREFAGLPAAVDERRF